MQEIEAHFALWQYLPWLKSPQRRALYQAFETPVQAYVASKTQLAALGLSLSVQNQWLAFARAPLADHANQATFEQLCALEHTAFIPIGHSLYPTEFYDIDTPPEALYVWGDTAVLEAPGIAIVGSRRASAAGLRHAEQFASELAAAGFVVISGGALGVDAAAHTGALPVGKTIAFVGTGIDVVYPAKHRALYQQIAQHGAVISEFRLGAPPRAGHFPKRNRLIAALAQGTLVVEAALKSGSLITARLATECNREVFAIPGSIDDPRAKGCNALIKQGAKLTENLMDIVEEFPRQHAQQSAQNVPETTDEEQGLLAAIDFAYTPLELIAQRSQLAVHELLPQLLALEMAQLVANEGGGYRRL